MTHLWKAYDTYNKIIDWYHQFSTNIPLILHTFSHSWAIFALCSNFQQVLKTGIMQLVNQTQNLESSYHPLQKTLLNFPQIPISQCHMGHIQSHFQNYTNSKNLHSPTEQSTTIQYKQTQHIIQSLFGHTFKNNIVTISVHKTSKSFQTFSAISQKPL